MQSTVFAKYRIKQHAERRGEKRVGDGARRRSRRRQLEREKEILARACARIFQAVCRSM
jgi:hypothetical protein